MAHRRQAARLLPAQRSSRLRGEQVGEHVRELRYARKQAIVRVGVDRRRPRSHAREQAVQALVQHTRRAPLRGRQIPGRGLE